MEQARRPVDVRWRQEVSPSRLPEPEPCAKKRRGQLKHLAPLCAGVAAATGSAYLATLQTLVETHCKTMPEDGIHGGCLDATTHSTAFVSAKVRCTVFRRGCRRPRVLRACCEDMDLALLSAVALGDVAAVRRMAASVQDVNARFGPDGVSALLVASEAGHAEVARALLDEGADVGVKTAVGCTPLVAAAAHGHLPVVRLLLESGAPVDSAASGLDVSFRGFTEQDALHVAAWRGSTAVATALIEATSNPNSVTLSRRSGDQLTPLLLAATAGHECTVAALLQCRAQADRACGHLGTALLVAAQGGDEALAGLLLSAGASPNAAKASGQRPLQMASQAGHAGLLRLLLDADADVNLAGEKGSPPLHVAVSSGHAGLSQQLIASGAAINAARGDGTTAVVLALAGGHKDLAAQLVEHGGSVNILQGQGLSPVHIFVAAERGDAVRALAELEADLEQPAAEGPVEHLTPLALAKERGHTAMAELLLSLLAERKATWAATKTSEGGQRTSCSQPLVQIRRTQDPEDPKRSALLRGCVRASAEGIGSKRRPASIELGRYTLSVFLYPDQPAR
eukprot:TRINITY_DN16250_c0_g1_i2.p1 TRINITY_DN16250_c0_g1~~TRINITY_DN16250_c0_g1_i2.p1  ORF type:complete len:593 (+),score=88.59 TRINITY_DN16250_c0_g1_i2:77-1780(+)